MKRKNAQIFLIMMQQIKFRKEHRARIESINYDSPLLTFFFFYLPYNS